MADINLKQVIHNVKEAYVTASGDTDTITYGNIATKVQNMSGGGGAINGCAVIHIQDMAASMATNTTITKTT